MVTLGEGTLLTVMTSSEAEPLTSRLSLAPSRSTVKRPSISSNVKTVLVPSFLNVPASGPVGV